MEYRKSGGVESNEIMIKEKIRRETIRSADITRHKDMKREWKGKEEEKEEEEEKSKYE